MRRTLPLLLALATTLACTEEHPNDFTIELLGDTASLALLARQELAVRDACETPDQCINEPCCVTQQIEVVGAGVDVPVAVATVDGRSVIVSAQMPGDATLTVRATLDDVPVQTTRTLSVRAPDQVTLAAPIPERPDRRNDLVCLPPALFEIGTTGIVPYRATAGGETLVTEGWMPVASSGPAIRLSGLGGTTTQPTQQFVADQVGEATIFAEVGQRSSVALVAVDAGDYDGVRIGHPGEVGVGRSVRIEVPVQVDRQDVCNDAVSRVIYIDTPDLCSFSTSQPSVAQPQATRIDLPVGVLTASLSGTRTGTCQLRVRVNGTNLEATASISVR